MQPTSLPAAVPAAPDEVDLFGKLSGTRRTFIRGIAAAGASTAVATALDQAGILDLFADEALAEASGSSAFSNFTALAASKSDVLEVPAGFRADVLIGWGDAFANTDGIDEDHALRRVRRAGGEGEEGQEVVVEAVPRQGRDERQGLPRQLLGRPHAVGHGAVVRGEENYDGYGVPVDQPTSVGSSGPSYADFNNGWTQVDPDYNANSEPGKGGQAKFGWVCEHDPYDAGARGRKHTALGRFRHENAAFRQAAGKKFVLYMGDDEVGGGLYKFVSDRSFVPGDQANNVQILEHGTLYIAKWAPEGVRRFTSAGQLLSGTSGTGEWVALSDAELLDTRLMLGGYTTLGGAIVPPLPDPGGTDTTARTPTRRYKQGTAAGDTDPANDAYAGRFNRDIPTPAGLTFSGTPPATINEYDYLYGTNRPEDVEVDADGSIYLALTNYSSKRSVYPDGSRTTLSVNDSHGSLRRIVEAGNDPHATTFTWEDFAVGGPTGRPNDGEKGFSSPDNLVFDGEGNVWVVTDISSGSLNAPSNAYTYHANNAVFMVTRSGPNKGVAFRFANMPIEAEGTGPYFTPDFQTLFVNVQHPGEESFSKSTVGVASTFTSYWPRASKTDPAATPATPVPSTVAITRPVSKAPDPGSPVIPPPAADRAAPRVKLTAPSRRRIGAVIEDGLGFRVELDEAARLRATLTGTLKRTPRRRRARRCEAAVAEALAAKAVTLAKGSMSVPAGETAVRVRIRRNVRARLRKQSAVSATLTIRAVDGTGNRAVVRKKVRLVR